MAAKFVTGMAVVASTLADPSYQGAYPGYYRGPGIAAHPNGATSYVGRTIWGLQKRSADAEPGYYGYGAYPGFAYGPRAYGPGIATHPNGATSFVERSPQGLRGKRSAEPGYARSFQEVSRPYANSFYRLEDNVSSARIIEDNYNGLPGLRGKRSAEPGYAYPAAFSYQEVNRPLANSFYRTEDSVYAARRFEDNYNGLPGLRGKRSAEPGYAYPVASSFQEVSRPYANSFYRLEDNVSSARIIEDNYNGLPGLRGKRSAEPGYGANSFQTVTRPGSTYTVNDRVANADVKESNDNFGAAYTYGFQAGNGYYH